MHSPCEWCCTPARQVTWERVFIRNGRKKGGGDTLLFISTILVASSLKGEEPSCSRCHGTLPTIGYNPLRARGLAAVPLISPPGANLGKFNSLSSQNAHRFKINLETGGCDQNGFLCEKKKKKNRARRVTRARWISLGRVGSHLILEQPPPAMGYPDRRQCTTADSNTTTRR